MKSLSQQLCGFLAAVRFADLPLSSVKAAKYTLLDIAGVGLIGSREDAAKQALAGLLSLDASGSARAIWGRTERLPAPQAAIANGVAAHCLDFDDTHTDSITHGSAVLGPTVMALGEQLAVSGEQLLLAYIAGWEVTARVGLAARGTFHKRGFHTTSVAGVYGATAAAAKLLELDADQFSHALGLAGSQVSGVSEYLSNGSSAKSFHPGWAAASGIVAAHLAKSGMTGPMTVFEGRYGLFKTYGVEAESDLERLTRGLGSGWEVERVSIKPYPCCHFAHAFIDCTLALRARGIAADAVENVRAVVPEIELPLICEPFAQKLVPDSSYAAKFSLPFLLAAAHIDGRIDHRTFAPEQIRRPDLLAFAQRVSYRVAAPGETTFPKYFPGLIVATLKDGGSIEERLDVNTGNPDNPLTPERIEDKFRANAQSVIPPAQAEGLIETVRNLERREASDLARYLAVQRSESPRLWTA